LWQQFREKKKIWLKQRPPQLKGKGDRVLLPRTKGPPRKGSRKGKVLSGAFGSGGKKSVVIEGRHEVPQETRKDF